MMTGFRAIALSGLALMAASMAQAAQPQANTPPSMPSASPGGTPPSAVRPKPPEADAAPEQEAVAPELAALLQPEPEARICFGRKYDAKHLAAHPDQKVTEIRYNLTWHVFSEEEGGQGAYLFLLSAKRRGDRELLHASGPCMVREGKVFCGVECDGGGLYAKRRDDGSLLLSFDDMWGIRMTPDCGEEEEDAVSLEPGKDDKSFRLDPLPASACPAYDEW